MAITVLTDASVTYNSVDLSNHVTQVVVEMASEDVDVTAMGATARNHAPGLRNDSVTVTFLQDFASAAVDQTLNGFVGSSAGATLVVKPTSAAVSSTNPSYTVTASPFNYHPLDGQIGAASTTQVQFLPVAGSKIVRAIT